MSKEQTKTLAERYAAPSMSGYVLSVRSHILQDSICTDPTGIGEDFNPNERE